MIWRSAASLFCRDTSVWTRSRKHHMPHAPARPKLSTHESSDLLIEPIRNRMQCREGVDHTCQAEPRYTWQLSLQSIALVIKARYDEIPFDDFIDELFQRDARPFQGRLRPVPPSVPIVSKHLEVLLVKCVNLVGKLFGIRIWPEGYRFICPMEIQRLRKPKMLLESVQDVSKLF